MPESFVCTCGDAVGFAPDGSRIALFDFTPHLDHTAYLPWARRHGFTDASLGWFPQVLDYHPSIRVHLVSDRLLWRCGLIPGVDWDQYPPWSLRGTTTAGQPLSGFSAPSVWDDDPPRVEEPRGRAEMPVVAESDPPESTDMEEPESPPAVAKRFASAGGAKEGRSASARWGR